MPDHDIRKWLIEGRVQGVFFRESTRREAEPLGLSGHAVNLPDGRVEVVAAGESAGLDRLEAWLASGPEAARVDTVERVAAPDEVPSGFRTG
jgi:acylphosphatase